jgi:N6-L-threonylcarbamoyladenine synthase
MRDDGFDFSFSGLKTAVINHVRRHPDAVTEDVAASFQAAAVDVLAAKLARAAQVHGAASVALAGGVAANTPLRERVAADADAAGLACLVPGREYCTDNAAMVAAAAWYRWQSDGPSPLNLPAVPGLRLAD